MLQAGAVAVEQVGKERFYSIAMADAVARLKQLADLMATKLPTFKIGLSINPLFFYLNTFTFLNLLTKGTIMLFTPFTFPNGKTAKNRIFKSAMEEQLAQNDQPSEKTRPPLRHLGGRRCGRFGYGQCDGRRKRQRFDKRRGDFRRPQLRC